jgi:hypothetical protein
MTDSDIEGQSRHLTHSLTYNERAVTGYPIINTHLMQMLIFDDDQPHTQDVESSFVWCEDCNCSVDLTGLTIESLNTMRLIINKADEEFRNA